MTSTKKIILIGIIFIIVVISFCIPTKKSPKEWVNDSEISDVGHYEIHYYNIYGMVIRTEVAE